MEDGTETLTHMHIRIGDATARRARALADLDGVSPSEVTEAALTMYLDSRGIPQASTTTTKGGQQ